MIPARSPAPIKIDTPAEAMLRELFPALVAAEAVVALLRQMMVDQGRIIAAERGVPFMRDEQLRREFGPT